MIFLTRHISEITAIASEFGNTAKIIVEWESLQVRINLYRQMKEQLLLQMKLYHTQRREELAKLISESIYWDHKPSF